MRACVPPLQFRISVANPPTTHQHQQAAPHTAATRACASGLFRRARDAAPSPSVRDPTAVAGVGPASRFWGAAAGRPTGSPGPPVGPRTAEWLSLPRELLFSLCIPLLGTLEPPSSLSQTVSPSRWLSYGSLLVSSRNYTNFHHVLRLLSDE